MGNEVDVIVDGSDGHTYHLTPTSVWENHSTLGGYRPEAFEQEGFIHCTDGRENVLAVGNRYYRTDPRPYVVLVISTDRILAPTTYDDADRIYPHIYGELNRDAVIAVKPMLRGSDGMFTDLGE